MNEILNNPEEVKTLLPRFRIFYGGLFVTFLTLLLRIWFLQIYQGPILREFSERNHLKQIKIQAPRGLMLDKEGRAIVENRLGYEAYLQSQFITDWDQTINTIAPLIGTTPDKLNLKVKKIRKQIGRFKPVKLKDNLSLEEVFRLKRARLTIAGLDIRETVTRNYLLNQNGAQIFGYVGEISERQLPLYKKLYPSINFEQGDTVGKFGLEELIEEQLHGENGVRLSQVDAFGREIASESSLSSKESQQIFGSYIKAQKGTPGKSVVLTIDLDLQKAAWDAFTENQRIGGAVVLGANGETLALVSTPSFNPNDFLGGVPSDTWKNLINDPHRPLRNKLIQDYFSPGSTFKPLVALSALQEKVISPQSVVYCPGALPFGNRFFHDHLKSGFGNITILEALERSSNVFFYKLGISLGVDKMHKYISAMGIGSKTGIELSREAPGLMPSSAWKKKNRNEDWHPGENLSVAIGQGFIETTPLQMAVAYLAIGSEGRVVKPFLIKKILNQEGQVVTEYPPQVVRHLSEPVNGEPPLIDPHNYAAVKEGLRRVVNGTRGTARNTVRLDGVEIAGKTGTAQVRGFSASELFLKCENRPLHLRHHGWFIGYAPADKPEIAVAVIAEHSCHGSSGAGPIVRAIMKKYFEKYHPEMNVKIPQPLYAPTPPSEGE